jgi:uncharacterized protein
MWFAGVDDTIFLRTEAHTALVRRIARRPIVKVAACTIRGKPLGDYIECTARIAPRAREAEAERALRRGYGPLRRLLSNFGRDAHVYLELTPIDLRQRSLPEPETLPRDDRAANGIGTRPDYTPPDAA